MVLASWWVKDPEGALHVARRIRCNRKPCSCQMCCNPRRAKWTRGQAKLTIQERRFLLNGLTP